MILWDHIVLYVLWGLCLHNLINCTSLCWWGTPFVSNFWGMPWNFRSSGIRSFRQQWQQQATEGSALCQWGVHGMWMAMDLASELRWRGWKAGGLSMVNGISMGYRPSTGTGGVFFVWNTLTHDTHDISEDPVLTLDAWDQPLGIPWPFWGYGGGKHSFDTMVLPISSCFGIAKGCWFGIAQFISCYIRLLLSPQLQFIKRSPTGHCLILTSCPVRRGGDMEIPSSGQRDLCIFNCTEESVHRTEIGASGKNRNVKKVRIFRPSSQLPNRSSCVELEVNGICFKSGLYWFVVDHLNLQWYVPLFLWVWS